MALSKLLSQIISLYGTPRIVALPEADPDGDQSAAFEQLRQQLQGANPVLFTDIAPGQLDRFFHLRLAQVLRREPPLPALSVVMLTSNLKSSRLAGGFADRFRSGWPFAASVFVTETGDPAPLAACLGLPVERPDAVWIPSRSLANASQKIGLQVQWIWGRCGSTTGFENQVESLVRAGYLTIRVFSDANPRRGPTLTARLADIIAENNTHAGAHVDVVAVPDGPPIAIRARDHETYWATYLAATARCRVRDTAIVAAMERADAVVTNHLERVGLAIAMAPRARLLLDVRDDRVVKTIERMRAAGWDAAEQQTAAAAVSRAQTAILAIPDICTHVNAAEFERLGRQSQRAAIVLPRAYVKPAPEPMAPRYDLLVFGDEHAFNIASLRWFLDDVWRPLLAPAGITVAIAGRAGNHVRDGTNELPLLHFLGFVEDLDALRSECQLTVVPDRRGTGVAVKTLTTLAASHPLVSTSVGLRGLDPSVAGLLPAHDDPAGFAADILDLARNPARLAERRRLVLQAHAATHRRQDHATLLQKVPRPTPSVRREREAKWARATAGANVPDARPHFFAPGEWFGMSGSARDHQVLLEGWHAAEAWGRWTDGAQGRLRVALAAPATEGLTLELDIVTPPAGATLSLSIDESDLETIEPSSGCNTWDIPPDLTLGKASFVITARVSKTVWPAASGTSSDTRILGLGLNRVRLLLSDA